jgi:hypothetical protein
VIHYGVNINIRHKPSLSPDFIPFYAFAREYAKGAERKLALAVEREGGYTSVYETHIHGTEERYEADYRYVERLTRFMLWARGGFRISLYCDGAERLARRLSAEYATGGRSFDRVFFSKVFEQPLNIRHVPYREKPASVETSKPFGRCLDGNRIGFDAGGSDRKVSAVIDGETVYSEEVVWHPKLNSDPHYHYQGILDAFRVAASKMPSVDAIGVSTAGIVIDNRVLVASLFQKIPTPYPKDDKNIYIRAARAIGDVPVAVANDGDVSALAGSMSYGQNSVMGIAMGTSQAGGYIDKHGNVTGWLNELAFVPVDLSEEAAYDENASDIGTGCKYFSQDAVIRLAERAGLCTS